MIEEIGWHMINWLACLGLGFVMSDFLYAYTGQGFWWHLRLGFHILYCFLSWGMHCGLMRYTLSFYYKEKPRRIIIG